MRGKHITSKSPNDSTYNAQWSGVSYTPHVKGIRCEDCKRHLHTELDTDLYCPYCDDYKHGEKGAPIDL